MPKNPIVVADFGLTPEMKDYFKDDVEFIEKLMTEKPPAKRPAKDKSTSAFEYACARLKIDGAAATALLDGVAAKKASSGLIVPTEDEEDDI